MKQTKQRRNKQTAYLLKKQKKAGYTAMGRVVVYDHFSLPDPTMRIDLMEGMMNIFCKHLVKGMSRDT